MPTSGMAMMLKSLGIDPDEIRANVEQFMAGMKAAVEKVEANQLRIEGKLEDLQKQGADLDEQNRTIIYWLGLAIESGGTTRLKDNGKDLGIIEHSEKFPQDVINAANAKVQASNFDAVKVGGQDG